MSSARQPPGSTGSRWGGATARGVVPKALLATRLHARRRTSRSCAPCSRIASTPMRFWDSSAIVRYPGRVDDPGHASGRCKDPVMLVWWASEVECASALARLEREDALDDSAVRHAFERFVSWRVDGTRSIPATPFATAAWRSCACIHSARPTPSSWPRRSSPQNGVPLTLKSSRSTSNWPPLRAKRDSRWSMCPQPIGQPGA